jgi:DNA-binding beta-propeller fold protein YncE
MRIGRLLGTIACALLCVLGGTGAAGAATPVQLAGTAGCVALKGVEGCAAGRAIAEPQGPLVISPDGASAYLVAHSDPEALSADALDVFDRDPNTGALTQKPGAAGCLAASGRDGCARDAVLFGAQEAIVSPDGRNVYVTTRAGVAAFARDATTGALTPLGGAAECLGAPVVQTPCQVGVGLERPDALAASPDGSEVYVTNDHRPTIAILRRDPVTGELSQPGGSAGCVVADRRGGSCRGLGRRGGAITAILATPDGTGVYVIAVAEGVTSVGIFSRRANGSLRRIGGRTGCLRKTGPGGCPGGRGLRLIEGIALSPDGHSLYVTSTYSSYAGAISTFTRGPGARLSQAPGTAGCLSANGGECGVDKALSGAGAVAVSPYGTPVYVAGLYGLAVLDRDESGVVWAPSGAAACLSDFHKGCIKARNLEATEAVATSPDGNNVYVTSLEPGGVSTFTR